jgi:hypothetical protein
MLTITTSPDHAASFAVTAFAPVSLEIRERRRTSRIRHEHFLSQRSQPPRESPSYASGAYDADFHRFPLVQKY